MELLGKGQKLIKQTVDAETNSQSPLFRLQVNVAGPISKACIMMMSNIREAGTSSAGLSWGLSSRGQVISLAVIDGMGCRFSLRPLHEFLKIGFEGRCRKPVVLVKGPFNLLRCADGDLYFAFGLIADIVHGENIEGLTMATVRVFPILKSASGCGVGPSPPE